jgi:hypothetical protein
VVVLGHLLAAAVVAAVSVAAATGVIVPTRLLLAAVAVVVATRVVPAAGVLVASASACQAEVARAVRMAGRALVGGRQGFRGGRLSVRVPAVAVLVATD